MIFGHWLLIGAEKLSGIQDLQRRSNLPSRKMCGFDVYYYTLRGRGEGGRRKIPKVI